MTSDTAAWSRCPRCGYPANHPDGGARQIGTYELLRFGPEGWSLVEVRVLCCGVCERLWPIPWTAIALDEIEVRARTRVVR
jgi:hypothetical protein